MNNLKILKEKVQELSILILDDEVDVLDRSVTFFKKFFKHVDSANNGASGLKKFSENNGYDIVVTDIKMPGLSGWEVIAKLREMDTNLFIIAMTGSPEVSEDKLAMTDAYLDKPVSVDTLLNIFEKIVEKRGL